MDRTRSAPATVSIGSSISATYNATNLHQRSKSIAPMWPAKYDGSTNDYTLFSESAPIRKQLESIDETSTFTNNAMVEYTPDEFVSKCAEPSRSPSYPLAHLPESRQLQVQLTPNMQWSPSMNGSISPSTPSTALATPVTQSSNDMSRQSSFNPHFYDHYSMLRVHSDSSSIFPPLLSEDGSFSYVDSKGISACADTPHFLNFTGSSSEAFLSPAPVISSASALEPYDENERSMLLQPLARLLQRQSKAMTRRGLHHPMLRWCGYGPRTARPRMLVSSLKLPTFDLSTQRSCVISAPSVLTDFAAHMSSNVISHVHMRRLEKASFASTRHQIKSFSRTASTAATRKHMARTITQLPIYDVLTFTRVSVGRKASGMKSVVVLAAVTIRPWTTSSSSGSEKLKLPRPNKLPLRLQIAPQMIQTPTMTHLMSIWIHHILFKPPLTCPIRSIHINST
jgi:hypothetical protein